MPRSGPSEAGHAAQPSPGARKWILLPVVWLLLVGGAAGLAFLARSWLPYLVGGVLCISWLAWMLAAALSPALPDCRCPRCGKEKLEPLMERWAAAQEG